MSEINNIAYGETFRKIRKQLKLSLSDFKNSVSKTKLSNFERGETSLSLEELQESLKIMKIPVDIFIHLSNNLWTDSNYGRIFRDIREQRGYLTNEFEDVGIPEYLINDFEDGRITLAFDSFEDLLGKMNVPISDYMYLVSCGQRDSFLEIFMQIEQAFYKNDRIFLEAIYKEKIVSPYLDNNLIAISAKCQYSYLEIWEQEIISDFIMGVEYWTSFECFILSCVAGELSPKMLKCLIKDFRNKDKILAEGGFYRHCLVKAMVRVVFYFMSIGDRDTSQIALEYASEILKPVDSFLQLLYKFGHGYWIFCQGEEEGKMIMDRVINIFKFLGDDVVYNKILNIRDYYIKLQK